MTALAKDFNIYFRETFDGILKPMGFKWKGIHYHRVYNGLIQTIDSFKVPGSGEFGAMIIEIFWVHPSMSFDFTKARY